MLTDGHTGRHLRSGCTVPENPSFVVTPEPEDLDHPLVLEHLVHQTMLDVDPARTGPCKITDELLERRWLSVRIFRDQRQ